MRLCEFILANIEPILVEWETFARSFAAGAVMDPVALRDHAKEILLAVARDMATPQTGAEQSEKSRGRGGHEGHSVELNGASEEHGVSRVGAGFDLMAVVAEYRALRASVVRLWQESRAEPDADDLADLTRFNESIDQSLARGVRSYTERINRSRQLFLAILSHDLRNPLNSIGLVAETLRLNESVDEDAVQDAAIIGSSVRAMGRMISDLLDFTSAGLGAAMPIKPAAMDLRPLCDEVLDEIRSAHPSCKLTLKTHGDLTGRWDRERLRQLLSNLLGNGVQHGDDACGVNLTVRAESGPARGGASDGGNADRDHIRIDVHNDGVPIPPQAAATIFDPLVRVSPELQRSRRPGSIGLGLYIAREVVHAHGGEITVHSTADAGTTFTARLPRGRGNDQ